MNATLEFDLPIYKLDPKLNTLLYHLIIVHEVYSCVFLCFGVPAWSSIYVYSITVSPVPLTMGNLLNLMNKV